MEFSRPEYWSGKPFPSPGDLPNPGIEPRSPALQADSLPAEPQGKPKNAGVDSLSLLRRIFPTQELNRGLLHYRHILYQLSYEGSPNLLLVNLIEFDSIRKLSSFYSVTFIQVKFVEILSESIHFCSRYSGLQCFCLIQGIF